MPRIGLYSEKGEIDMIYTRKNKPPTMAMIDEWKNLRGLGLTVKQIAERYQWSESTVSLYTHMNREKIEEFMEMENIEPVSVEEFRKRDCVDNRNIRGLSGKELARLLIINKEYDERRLGYEH